MFMIASVIFYACSYNSSQESSVNPNTNSSSNILTNENSITNITWENYVVKNLNNPYDFAGYYHNAILDASFQYIDVNDLEGSLAEAINLGSCDVFHTNGEECETIVFPENVDYNNLNLSTEAEVFNSSLSTFFVANDYNATTTWNIVNTWQNNITVWETNVINSNLNSAEKKILLSSSAVARYSITYWTYQVLNEGDWYTAKSSSNGPLWGAILAAAQEDSRSQAFFEKQQELYNTPSDETISSLAGKASLETFMDVFFGD